MPPSANKLLGEIGVLEAVQSAGFRPNHGNSVWWAGQPVRHEFFSEGLEGYHVERRSLEDVLVAAAETSGVRIYPGYSARAAIEDPEGWIITCEASNGSSVGLRASFIIDATGRRGLLARREGREPDPSTTTLSVLGHWRKPGGWDPETAHNTLIESYEDGWAWSVPLDAQTRCFSVVIDQRQGGVVGGGAMDILTTEFMKTAHIGPLLAGSVPTGKAWACPSSLYAARRYARRGLVLAGDAGSFIDPLSSFGIKKALSSGWLGGIVTHTSLVDPSMAETAVDFFDQREHEVYRTYRRLSATYFEEAAAVYDHPYWRSRAESARAGGGWSEDSTDDPDFIRQIEVPEAEVRAAFEVIRARQDLGAAVSSDLSIFKAPAIEGHRIILARHLASKAYPEGVRFINNVDLCALIELLPAHSDVPELWAAYNGVSTPVSLPDFLTALATTFAAGFVHHETE